MRQNSEGENNTRLKRKEKNTEEQENNTKKYNMNPLRELTTHKKIRKIKGKYTKQKELIKRNTK